MNCLSEFVHECITTMWLCFSVFDEHVRRSKVGGGNSREMDFESFLDFVLALENKDTPEGLTYLFRCLDLNGRGFLTTADIHTLFRYVIMYALIYTVLLICYWILMAVSSLMIDLLVHSHGHADAAPLFLMA